MYETSTDLGLVKDPGEYKPKKQELLQQYQINIEFLSIGCVVKVGCKSIPFTSVEEAMKQINAYVNDPETASTYWRKIIV